MTASIEHFTVVCNETQIAYFTIIAQLHYRFELKSGIVVYTR